MKELSSKIVTFPTGKKLLLVDVIDSLIKEKEKGHTHVYFSQHSYNKDYNIRLIKELSEEEKLKEALFKLEQQKQAVLQKLEKFEK